MFQVLTWFSLILTFPYSLWFNKLRKSRQKSNKLNGVAFIKMVMLLLDTRPFWKFDQDIFITKCKEEKRESFWKTTPMAILLLNYPVSDTKTKTATSIIHGISFKVLVGIYYFQEGVQFLKNSSNIRLSSASAEIFREWLSAWFWNFRS